MAPIDKALPYMAEVLHPVVHVHGFLMILYATDYKYNFTQNPK